MAFPLSQKFCIETRRVLLFKYSMRIVLTFLLITIFAACSAVPRQSGGDILVIGDSMLAWHYQTNEDVGSVIAEELGREVAKRAEASGQIRPGGFSSALGLRIEGQMLPGPWNWVVMNGGANDLRFSCGCQRCEERIETLISRDRTSGDIPALIRKAQAQGARVVWMGYYRPPSARFEDCRPYIEELERRVAAYASRQNGVYFIDAEEVVTPQDRSLFYFDGIHPSTKGSARLGRHIAAFIARTR